MGILKFGHSLVAVYPSLKGVTHLLINMYMYSVHVQISNFLKKSCMFLRPRHKLAMLNLEGLKWRHNSLPIDPVNN